MSTKKIIKHTGRYALLLSLLLLCFCAESEEVIRGKLDVILADDMKAILDGVDSEGLLDEPYFVLLDYRKYDEGAYSRLAIVDFFFLRTVNVKITRKYRYHKRLGMWDRYYNRYYTFTPDTQETDTRLTDAPETNGTEN